ncbi:hypothetical protein [Chitinophaga silvatica]|nr:hypothetical protein [Chitinophaga silvatica]
MRFMIIYFSIVSLIFATSTDIKGQTINEKTTKFIYNKVSKNLIAYHLQHASPDYNGVIALQVLTEGGLEFFDGLLPDEGQKLIMTIDTSDLKYPLSKYKVFKIFIPGFRFLDTVEKVIKVRMGIGLLTRDFLVAVALKNEYLDIKYLSGQFYPTRISYDFNIDLDNPNSCVDYLNFRMYSYKVRDIVFYKKNRKGLLFKGYSDIEKSPVLILLPKDDIERPYIVRLH